MPDNTFTRNKPMSELKTDVLRAIQSGTTDEEKAKLSIRAMSFLYLKHGHFGRSYELDEENGDAVL
jgi:hypothetical protein